ncbi:hypothetical protein [Streptomyces harbinensis]|uniref:Uncharacterized protein n=1 Tax=Streptomyces harbinensis TaxID=1176198 RepID=A0A1I6WAW9_9ACTN|nr:hypothetical protein [Streptomyces harbinensis]SFT23128.1 hypothetical protein SAMN05444716_11638 [Streptomyces harbinensis]
MTLVIDHLRALQHEGGDGPELWQAAWDRAIDLLAQLWPDATLGWDGDAKANGGAGLAAGLYLVARERDTTPADVTRDDIQALIADSHDLAIVDRWATRLRALGHDPEDPDDPIAIRWRHLRWDMDYLPDHLWEAALQDISMSATRPALIDGLQTVLADNRLQF